MEVREHRCCMCPNIGVNTNICPPGPIKPDETICNFVVTWKDDRNWKYKVMGGIGGKSFKGRCQKNEYTGNSGWKGMRQLEWKSTFEEAQEDLNKLAKAKKWEPINI